MHQDWYTYSIYNATIQVQSSLSMRRPTMRSIANSTAWNSDFGLLVIQPYYKQPINTTTEREKPT